MRNNPNIRSDCFNRLCYFHLKTGDSFIGGVTDDSNGNFEVELMNNTKRKFPISLVHSYEVRKQEGWQHRKVRTQLFGNLITSYNRNIKTKKMIIFGAGASYDLNIKDANTKIPLSNNLFDDSPLLNHFPGAQNLKPKILTAVHNGESLENFFQEKWNEVNAKGDLELLYKLINIQYYIQLYFSDLSKKLYNKSPNNYTSLLRHCQNYLNTHEGENIALVSFNYDTLLENAMEEIFDYEFETQADYVFTTEAEERFHKPLMLFKPHGSWNWVHKFQRPMFDVFNESNSGIECAKAVFNSKLSIADLLFAINPQLEDTDIALNEIPTFYTNTFNILKSDTNYNFPFYPNLLIPFSEKDNILMPKLHEEVFSHKIYDVEEILIIGWKGTEKYFNEILKRYIATKKIQITYIDPFSETVETELKKYLPLAEFKKEKTTFTNYLNTIKGNKDSEINFFK